MSNNVIALDVGEKRIGVAIASLEAKLPRPYTTLTYDAALEQIVEIVASDNVVRIVVGLPLNRDNLPTTQTRFTEQFIERLKARVEVPIDTCDEALSSLRAKEELLATKKVFAKADVDALAATYILDDYLKEAHEV